MIGFISKLVVSKLEQCKITEGYDIGYIISERQL